MRDIDIRHKLKQSQLKKYYVDSDCKVVDELNVCLGDARVDIAVINGAMHGYEIKSEHDTLARLPSQLVAYSKTFDFLTIITCRAHYEKVVEIAPAWCGIILVEPSTKKNSDFRLTKVRRAKRNINIDKYSVAQLLWKSEVIDILSSLGIKKGLNSKPKPFLWDLLVKTVDYQELSGFVRHQLKSRTNWRSEIQLF